MDHGSAPTNACKVDMLWNWNSKDACFLSSGWQIVNGGMMAASCIGVALLVVLLELLRLMGKRFDATLLSQMKRRGKTVLEISAQSSGEAVAVDASSKQRCQPATLAAAPRRKIVMRVSPVYQFLRAVLYAVTFAVAYIVMLLAMSYNGYIIFSIIIGAGLGKFLTDWLTCTVVLDGEDQEPRPEGIEELTVCCQ